MIGNVGKLRIVLSPHAEITINEKATQQMQSTVIMTFSFTILSTFLLGSNTNSTVNPRCGGHSGYSVPRGKGKSFFCRPPLYGRYVTIRSLMHGDALTLCEVEVYSERRGMINSYSKIFKYLDQEVQLKTNNVIFILILA